MSPDLSEQPAAGRRDGAHRGIPAAWPAALALLFAGALGLRLWSIRHGLPYLYNVDESGHFASVAVQTAISGWNPHYFENPPAFSYLLRLIFQVGWGTDGLIRQWNTDPTPMLITARATSAVLGSGACVLVAMAGARLWNRLAGLIAGALLAVACLPVVYSHFALNDVPALAPIALALVGAAGLAKGSDRRLDWIAVGVGAGLAGSVKYTAAVAGLMLVPILVERRGSALKGTLIAASAGLIAFVATNPYSLLARHEFIIGLRTQSDVASHRLAGLWTENPLLYYPDAAVWGFGALPLLAAGIGLVLLARRRDWTVLAILALPPIVLLGSLSANGILTGQGQMYARWLLPALPFLALAAGLAGSEAIAAPAKGRPKALLPLAGVVIVAMCAQGLLLSVRSDTVLGRTDTRQALRDWMVANVPRGTRIAAESYSLPADWFRNPEWAKPRIDAPPGPIWDVSERFLGDLSPSLLPMLRREGRCLVMVFSTVRGRAFVRPRQTPSAWRFYLALDATSRVLYRLSPWNDGRVHGFDFDRSYWYFDGAYSRPGPMVELRMLDDCRARPRGS